MGTAGLGHSELNMLSRKFQAPILASHYKLLILQFPTQSSNLLIIYLRGRTCVQVATYVLLLLLEYARS